MSPCCQVSKYIIRSLLRLAFNGATMWPCIWRCSEAFLCSSERSCPDGRGKEYKNQRWSHKVRCVPMRDCSLWLKATKCSHIKSAYPVRPTILKYCVCSWGWCFGVTVSWVTFNGQGWLQVAFKIHQAFRFWWHSKNSDFRELRWSLCSPDLGLAGACFFHEFLVYMLKGHICKSIKRGSKQNVCNFKQPALHYTNTVWYLMYLYLLYIMHTGHILESFNALLGKLMESLRCCNQRSAFLNFHALRLLRTWWWLEKASWRWTKLGLLCMLQSIPKSGGCSVSKK